VLIEQRLSPEVLKAAYGQMDLFLGTRLHSNVFALTEGVPVVAVGYQYKTRGVLRMLGLERWLVEIDQIDSDSLVSLLHKAWAERRRIRAHIREMLPRVRERASAVGAIVASDFETRRLSADSV